MNNLTNQKNIKQAVILAGGKGSRMHPFTETNPKPMYPINGIPFIEHLVLQIKGFGLEEILILLGYLPEKIKDYLGDGSKFGIKISYDITDVENETGTRLQHAKDLIDEHFLLMYCDNYCPIQFQNLYQEFINNDALIQLSAYENKDSYTKSNLLIGNQGIVEVYDKKRVTDNLLGVDIGYAIIQKKVFEYLPMSNHNFEGSIYSRLVEEKRLFATITKHRYYSVGSYERLEQTKKFFQHKPTIFLDRDGTINERAEKACYIEQVNDFKWLPLAREAIRRLKEQGFQLILITNQPGIARGNLTEQRLLEIHNKMQEDLREFHCEIDAIYYCPHNWDEGCECRKPKAGMLFQAQKEHCLNLGDCIFIGDDERDMLAGEIAGCKTVKVDDIYTLWHAVQEILGDE